MGLGAPVAQAAGPPEVAGTWVETVKDTSANLHAEIDPKGSVTTFRFEYVTAAAFAVTGFSGSIKAPLGGEANAGSGEGPVAVTAQHIGGLAPVTSYRYRVVAKSAGGTTIGPTRPLQTYESAPVFSLPDGRGWELVSPSEKNGGEVAAPETLFGGGVLQAAAQGGALTYGSAFSFGGAQGAPGASQYLSHREAGGWSTQNLTVPQLSGGYPGQADSGVLYQVFSSDLQGALLSNGKRCRGEATQCPVANRNYYRRDSTGAFKALLGSADLTGQTPTEFEAALAGATPDLSQVVLSSCAALTADAIEVAGTGGECDPSDQNLYLSTSSGLLLVNLLPGAIQGTPGATLAQGAGNVAPTRAYFTLAGNLYLREGAGTVWVDQSLGGGGLFQVASSAGDIAFLTKDEHLYQYAGGVLTDLTPSGGVLGVLGASADGSYLYYVTAGGLFLHHGATDTFVASAVDSGNYPPATGTARVSPDGTHLVFASTAELTGYDSNGKSELYLYSVADNSLRCASCNPSGERPLGSAGIPGAIANGQALRVYKPRALSAAGTRLFFDSPDPLVIQDTDNAPDVYQWEAAGTGSCAQPAGCVNLISSGRSEPGATFIDASVDGADAFFLSEASLVPSDPGAFDVYDAREGGGFPIPEPPTPCVGDACQVVPGGPEDPTPGTVAQRPEGNPPLSFPKEKKKKKKAKHKKHRHGKKHSKKQSDARKGGRG
jgi:hypothetical protein